MHHFWLTGGDTDNLANSIWSYYVDGETTPSVEFSPSMASGIGQNDSAAPWSNKWFGKQAKTGGWFNNFRIPFFVDIKITGRLAPGGPDQTGIYVIFRGTTNLPINIVGYNIPLDAENLGSLPKMYLQKQVNVPLQPLDFLDVASVTGDASGVVVAHTLAVESGNWNFLEGCYHAYDYGEVTTFPGIIVSTGTEDYYDSAFYFDAGQFYGENSGYTHQGGNDTHSSFSAYRIHDQDPLMFGPNGFRFQWRNGDVSATTGLKCTSITGSPDGNPQPSVVNTYTWLYSWINAPTPPPEQEEEEEEIELTED